MTKTAWLPRIPTAIAKLQKLEAEIIDRDTIAGVFGIQRTAAIDLLRRVGAGRVGKCLAIQRTLLLERLETLMVSPEYVWVIERHATIGLRIEAARQEAAARHHLIPTPANPAAEISSLQAGVSLEPGLLRVEYRGTEDLLQKLYELSQAIARDYLTFQQICDSPPVEVALGLNGGPGAHRCSNRVR